MKEELILYVMCFQCFDHVKCLNDWGRSGDVMREAKELVNEDDQDDGEGTYNPKNAWMFVDRRRRVLPDIDVEAHFASVENHILSDIHSYHMVGEARVSEDDNKIADDDWDEEDNDEYVISRFTPDRNIWRGADDYGWDVDPVAEARVGESELGDYQYEDSQDSSYGETVNTVQSVEIADRQFTTVGLPAASQPGTGWAQTFVNGSAVALLAFLFLLNLTQDVIAQITGKRRKRRRRDEEGISYKNNFSEVLEFLTINEDG